MRKVADRDLLEKIQAEITKRVFNRYAEIEGTAHNQTELQTTLQALRETTGLPMDDIQRIAAEVEKEMGSSDSIQFTPTGQTTESSFEITPVLPDLSVSELTFEELSKKVENGRKEFIIHTISFVFINSAFCIANLFFFSGFPWSIFPLLGWGVGLVAHYLDAIVWSKRDLDKKTTAIKNQIHHILNENWPQYRTARRSEWFTSVYRMVVSEADSHAIRHLLKHTDPELGQKETEIILAQLGAVQQKFILKKPTLLENIQKGLKDKLEKTFS